MLLFHRDDRGGSGDGPVPPAWELMINLNWRGAKLVVRRPADGEPAGPKPMDAKIIEGRRSLYTGPTSAVLGPRYPLWVDDSGIDYCA